MKKYIIKPYYQHIKGGGVYFAASLYEALEFACVRFIDYDLETAEKELEETGCVFLGDFKIELGE
jgi:hypothetical protein